MSKREIDIEALVVTFFLSSLSSGCNSLIHDLSESVIYWTLRVFTPKILQSKNTSVWSGWVKDNLQIEKC